MKSQEYELVPAGDPISKSGIQAILNNIRPYWKGKNLIQRVEKLLPVDPSSACQRLFNAAIHDLKEKIIVIGVDLAKEAARNYKLPAINTEDDVYEYNVSKSIDLAYRMSILTRAEWRRIHRCYEIRRDLEHEDNEYEAVLEDCFYIFKSAIDIVLSQDPIEILKVVDARQIVEVAGKIILSEEFLENYRKAPILRQKEIIDLLISFASDDSKADIIRENSVEMMRHLRSLTNNTVIIEVASQIEQKMGTAGIDLKTAKISYACGAIAYFKKVRLKDFYHKLLEELILAESDWSSQAKIASKLEDIGGLVYCPEEYYKPILKKLVGFYIGVPSYGPGSQFRNVFFGNDAATIVARLIEADSKRIGKILEELRKDRDIKGSISNGSVSRRFESLVDISDID